jgi:tyrosine-protein phosphatase SIW14
LENQLCPFNYANLYIPNFQKVNEGIYRGGRSTEVGLDELNRLGIKTIINLEDNKKAVSKEQKYVSQFSMVYHSIPINSFQTPKDADVEKVLDLLQDPNNYPVFIHCQHGRDRTGMMMGLHRVFGEGWTSHQAYDEMLQLGFRRILFALDRYFKDKTNY